LILFRKLRWKNFLSTGNLFTELELNKHNTTLIVGENGAGKSTILDALSFCLFGKAFRNVNKPQLINTITAKGLVTEIEFSVGSNNYKIIRGLKPNIFEVYLNGSLLNQSAEMKDYQEILEKQILKINHKSFCQVVVLGSATFQPFMQLSSGRRREIIEDLLDLQIFTTMNQLLKQKVATNNEKTSEILSEQKVINEKIKLIKQHMLETQNSNDQLIDDKISRIEETKALIDEANNKLKLLNDKVVELSALTEDESMLKVRIDKIKKLRVQLDHKISNLKNDINFFENHKNCPTCNQDIEEEFRNKTVDDRSAQISEIESNLPTLIEQFESTNKKVSDIMEVQSKITDTKMEQHQIKTRISLWFDYINIIEQEMQNVVKKIQVQDDTKIIDLELELETFKNNFNELAEEKNILSAASSLLKDGGIKARIIKQYVPVINKLINKYLSAMDFFVQFELDEEFNETIKSRYRDDFSYASFSEGEKMRINLAILFTWRSVAKLRNSISTNLLIMDEVFDSSLDSNGTEEFMKILNQLTLDTNTFIISHKGDQLVDKFEHVIKFEKKQNFSKIAA
jgi:DNA repair exonuclease SbcCD ATPase subunit